MRINTGLDNGKSGDAHVSLIVCSLREMVSDTQGRGDELEPALLTNAGPFFLDATTQASIDSAAKQLNCQPADIRSALFAVFPGAANWDWAETQVADAMAKVPA